MHAGVNVSSSDAAGFALAAVWAYLGSMNKYSPGKYSPIVSEFGSAEEEAAYDAWFRKKVAKSLASDKPPIPHDEVMAGIRAIIDKAEHRQKAK